MIVLLKTRYRDDVSLLRCLLAFLLHKKTILISSILGIGFLYYQRADYRHTPHKSDSKPWNHSHDHPASMGIVNNSFKIAFLMSFPNSGTSYTSLLVRTVTGHNTATNYGAEGPGDDGTSVPVFDHSPEGPFWLSPTSMNLTKPNGGYLLTKTHVSQFFNQAEDGQYAHFTIFIYPLLVRWQLPNLSDN